MSLPLRGSLSPYVHLLSQMSEAHPKVQTTTIFADSFSLRDQASDQIEQFVQGDSRRVLVAIQNNGEEAIWVKDLTGAFVEVKEASLSNVEEKPQLKFIQNLTVDTYTTKSDTQGLLVAPGQTLTLATDFFAFTSIPAPKTYTLLLAVFYTDSRYEYSSVVFNQEVFVKEHEQSFGLITGPLSLLLTGVILFLFGFTIYVKVQDRFFPPLEDAKKRKPQAAQGALGLMRELISSRQ